MYYEFYLAEKRRNSDSLILPAIMVGIFDSTLLFLFILLLEPLYFYTVNFRDFFPSGISSLASISWTLFVSLIELIYYRLGRRDLKIISQFENFNKEEKRKVRICSLIYGVVVLGIGIGGLFLLW